MVLTVAVIGAYRGTLYAWGWFHRELTPVDEAANATLTIPQEELDLGRVWETDSREHVVHVTNATDRPVTIAHFVKTCNCIAITPNADVTFEPHATKAFALRLGLSSRAGLSAPMRPEPFRVRISALYAGQHEPTQVGWQLKAEVLPTLRLNPPLLRMGTKSDRQSIEETVQIEAGPGVQSIEGQPTPGWDLEISQIAGDDAGKKFKSVLRRKGDAKLGAISDVIRFHPLADQGRRLPPKELKVEGEVVRDVVADPRGIQHGRKPCGTSAEETIRLVSLTKRAFHVISAASTSIDLKVARVPEPGGGWLYSLHTSFTSPGEQVAVAQFTIQDDEGKEYKVAVPVRYCGADGPG